jgi:hypothetical protein
VQGRKRQQLAIPESETPTEPEANANGYATANGHSEEDPEAAAAATTAKPCHRAAAGGKQLRQQLERIHANHEREVVQQLECIQENHAREVVQLKTDLEESEAAKGHAGSQCQTLLGRIEKIKEARASG